jgi:uncharacterized protein YjbI with pentapeptide repeats
MKKGRVEVLTSLEKRGQLVGAALAARRFSGVDFSDTVFAKANCARAVFIDVDLRRVDFKEALLTNVLFLGCDFDGSDFAGASVAGARFVACSGLDPETVRRLGQGGAELPWHAWPGRGHVSRR